MTILDEERVVRLSRRTYGATELIAATGITGNMLTNYLTKAKVRLCSESSGQGSARKYHLLDVYTIGIIAALIRMTDNKEWAARTMEYMLFVPDVPIEMQSKPLTDGPLFPAVRDALVGDIRSARPMYWQRSWDGKPWFLFAETMYVRNNVFGCVLINLADNAERLWFNQEGFFLNVTHLLMDIDRKLDAMKDTAA